MTDAATPTLDDLRQNLREATSHRDDARARVETLEREQGEAGADALEGRPGAAERLSRIDGRLRTAHRDEAKWGRIVEQVEQRIREAQAREKAAERVRLEADLAALLEQRDQVWTTIQDRVMALLPQIREALALGAQAQGIASRLYPISTPAYGERGQSRLEDWLVFTFARQGGLSGIRVPLGVEYQPLVGIAPADLPALPAGQRYERTPDGDILAVDVEPEDDDLEVEEVRIDE